MRNKYYVTLVVLFMTTILSANVPPDWFDRHNSGNHEKNMAAGCAEPSGATFLELNNVRTIIFTGGDMWWDLFGTQQAMYEIPKGSGKMSNFLGGVWVGGTDVNGQLRVCAVRYRSSGVDYYTGPLITSGPQQASVTPEVCAQYDKHFSVYRKDVAKYRSYINAVLDNDQQVLDEFTAEGYVVPDIIYNWPAHGDAAAGYDYHLAPFYDANGNDYYDPENGDYPFFDLDGTLPCGSTPDKRVPRLYGDQTLWWVYNDKGNVHNESKGSAIGMEIRAQAFAFSTNDELNDMTFYHYELINRSTYTLKDCYFAVNDDADIGEASDDYTGCDVQRGLGYMYNGDEEDGDGNGWTYGKHPPAIGIDFFEGPYQDPDGSDYGASGVPNGCDESINGLNFNDGVVDNERWGMRRFIYYKNSSGNMGDPNTATQYYNYMKGFWKDGTRLQYGGDGHSASGIDADFMFPGSPTTDPCGWGTAGVPQADWSGVTAGITPADMRFVQSAGPFTLKPGAVNDLTFGVVWARSNGSAWESVLAVQHADDKAQALFGNCFKVVDGPDAPEMKIIEMDQQLIFYIYNKKGSNNYKEIPEDYDEVDPFIVCCPDSTGHPSDCDKHYKFEGYQVYQLKNSDCSINDIHDPSKSKLVFQTDIKNGISQLVNYTYDQDMEANVPEIMVKGADEGLKHSFTQTQDMFATGDNALVNNKTYYYVAIAYAYNNYKTYDPTDASCQGQMKPYLSGRKGASGPIQVYPATPHKIENLNNGTVLHSTYGDQPEIVQIEGHGNGGNVLELADRTVDNILKASPGEQLDSVVYKPGYGPIKITVVDPLHLVKDDFILKFDSSSTNNTYGVRNGYIYDKDNVDKASRWYIERKSTGEKIWADNWINLKQNEYLLPDLGISVSIQQTELAMDNAYTTDDKNGFLEATIEYTDEHKPWLSFVYDNDLDDPANWIRAGKHKDTKSPCYDDYKIGAWWDEKAAYEQVLFGAWAPTKLVSADFYHLKVEGSGATQSIKYGLQPAKVVEQNVNAWKKYNRLPSVDIVITSDKSKWTRCPVVEMCENDTTGTIHAGPSYGGVKKFHLRKGASVDKNGKTGTADANLVSSEGMGWFPGYAIDVETGERLNMMFGEDSHFPAENGRDMIWNPTSNTYSDLYWYSGGTSGDVLWGGKHVIYVLGHTYYNPDKSSDKKKYMPAYDYGKTAYERLKEADNDESKLLYVYGDAVWTSIPILNRQLELTNSSDPYAFIQTDVKFRLRVNNPYHVNIFSYAKKSPQNENRPMYFFSTKKLAADTGVSDVAEDALDLIRIVPNPYYGYSGYETSPVDNKVKITNLPKTCTISIYMVNGVLIRRIHKDSELTYQDWDLKNQYGISIASGLYIIHIDAPGIGEKILKWFGVMRPLDLTNF